VNVLREVLPSGVSAAAYADARVADSDRADPARCGEVRLLQRRRAALSISDVVETERRTVGREERNNVNVEGEQVADRVGVFGAIQAAQRGPARIARAALVEFPFEPGDKRLGRGRFRPTTRSSSASAGSRRRAR